MEERRVLLVEDDPMLRMFLKHKLEKNKYTVAVCSTVTQALILHGQTRPHVAIIDIMLEQDKHEGPITGVDAGMILSKIDSALQIIYMSSSPELLSAIDNYPHIKYRFKANKPLSEERLLEMVEECFTPLRPQGSL